MPASEVPTPAAVLAWMSEHGAQLRRVVADEQAGERELAPGDDPTIRAHLRFAALALTATAGPDLSARLEGFAGELPGWFTESQPLYEDHLATGVGAIALEEHLQFGTRPGSDPSLDAALHRRLRIGAWIRIFLVGLERWLGPAADGLADQTLAAMGERGGDLARLILSFDIRAKAAARSVSGGKPVDIDIQDEIGQAAALRGHIRLMLESLTEVLSAPG
jgi:hypothetical protein